MRNLIDGFARKFEQIDSETRGLLGQLPEDRIFSNVGTAELPYMSAGTCLLRSAAAVEQTFGGITTRLWDDPFEWTLPEKLSTQELILEYLDEVAETRLHGLAFLASDDDLSRELPAPEKLRSIFSLLLETAATADHYLGRAAAIYQILTGSKIRRR
ncbi:MAG: hypothetical protein DCC44_03825 [Acidobacteria bacterium]|nr:hypothetical protein [Pyrinomonadaceae bacterium]RIJ94631.1 MAG: hypothetical protein DCC44_03825 [Acidobacteriota bacterium]